MQKYFTYFFAMLIALILVLSGCGANSPAAGSGGGATTTGGGGAGGGGIAMGSKFIQNHVLVKLAAGADPVMVANSIGGTVGSTMSDTGITQITLTGTSIQNALTQLSTNPNVLYAVPNYQRKAFLIPTDPMYAQQWGPKAIGSEIAWNTTTGGTGIIVAVLDTGVDGTHEDLSGQIMAGRNMGGFGGMGYTPPAPLTGLENSDDVGHGTHVSGIIAGKMLNGVGISGLAPAVRIMPVKVLQNGWGDDFTIAQGIIYAASNGAKIINMSLGGMGYSQVLQDAVTFANKRGVVVVAAMGNSGTGDISYPAACQGVIAVGATDPSRQKAAFSTTGSHISVSAPGVGILSSIPPSLYSGTKYQPWDGTSMATPHVAAVAALIFATKPGILPSQVKSQIEGTATHPATFNTTDGYGVVSASNAIGALVPNKYGSLTVTVTQTGIGVQPGANLVLRTPRGDLTTVTDSTGKGSFIDVPAGTYTLYVNGVGNGTTVTQAVTVIAGADTPVLVTYAANPTGIEGYITDSIGGAGVNGSTITLFTSTNAIASSTVTDINGYYLFKNLVAGTYSIVATKSAMAKTRGHNIVVNAGKMTQGNYVQLPVFNTAWSNAFAPAVTVTGIAPNGIYTASVSPTVGINVAAANAVKEIDFYIDSSFPRDTFAASGSVKFPLDPNLALGWPSLSNGSHSVKIVTWDINNNRTQYEFEITTNVAAITPMPVPAPTMAPASPQVTSFTYGQSLKILAAKQSAAALTLGKIQSPNELVIPALNGRPQQIINVMAAQPNSTVGIDVWLGNSWVMGATGYNIYVSSNINGPYTRIAKNVSWGYTDFSPVITPGVARYYKASAVNSGGEGPLSTPIGVIPLPQFNVSLVSPVNASTGVTTTPTFSWSQNANVGQHQHYHVVAMPRNAAMPTWDSGPLMDVTSASVSASLLAPPLQNLTVYDWNLAIAYADTIYSSHNIYDMWGNIIGTSVDSMAYSISGNGGVWTWMGTAVNGPFTFTTR